jgi:hypothetical protein
MIEGIKRKRRTDKVDVRMSAKEMAKLERLVAKYNEKVEVDEKKWGKATLIRALIAREYKEVCGDSGVE